MAAVVCAALLSFAIAAVASSLYADATVQQSRYTGVYVYDRDENALLPASFVSWYPGVISSPDKGGTDAPSRPDPADGGAASRTEGVDGPIYVERINADPDYYPTIYLDDLPNGFDLMEVADMNDESFPNGSSEGGEGDVSHSHRTLTFASIPSYDAAANEAYGDIDALRAAVSSAGRGSHPCVSYVGYYVYLAEGTWADVYVWATVVAIPAVCVVCFAVAARRFYRRKLERPIDAMSEAVDRVAHGDLDFVLEMDDGGELGRLGESFESMRAELNKANRAMWRAAENRRRANSAFAHDLRTPLTVLAGRAEMLAEFVPTGAMGPDQVAEVARSMQRQTARLVSYVESMRGLDALEAFVADSECIDLGEWFRQELEDAEALASRAEIMFVGDGSHVEGFGSIDAQAASRVVQNLIANAVNHATARIELDADWDGTLLSIRVRDDGAGFSDEALKHACEPYWRDAAGASHPDSRDEDAGHFGLGLNVCRILCEKLGGSLRLGNGPEGGADVVAVLGAKRCRPEQ